MTTVLLAVAATKTNVNYQTPYLEEIQIRQL